MRTNLDALEQEMHSLRDSLETIGDELTLFAYDEDPKETKEKMHNLGRKLFNLAAKLY
jgi:hypothetical protein